MGGDLKSYRRKINYLLGPIKVMLIHKQTILDKTEWLSFVEQTRASIINKPEQYLGTDLPVRDTLLTIVNNIFEEFLKNAHA